MKVLAEVYAGHLVSLIGVGSSVPPRLLPKEGFGNHRLTTIENAHSDEWGVQPTLWATLGLVFTGCIAAVRPAGHGCIELPKSSQGRCWQTVTAAGIGIVLDPLFIAAARTSNACGLNQSVYATSNQPTGAGVGAGIGIVFGSLIHSVSRNPSLSKQLFGYAILGFALSEAMALFALLVAFLILFGLIGFAGSCEPSR